MADALAGIGAVLYLFVGCALAAMLAEVDGGNRKDFFDYATAGFLTVCIVVAWPFLVALGAIGALIQKVARRG